MSVKTAVKRLADLTGLRYEVYALYTAPKDIPQPTLPAGYRFRQVASLAEFASAANPIVAAIPSHAEHAEDVGFAIEVSGCVVAGCVYSCAPDPWWPIASASAKLVHIETDPEHRGKGLAPALIAYSAASMVQAGHRELYARIWHSNQPSLRAFQKAGWSRVAFVVDVGLFGRSVRWVSRLQNGRRRAN